MRWYTCTVFFILKGALFEATKKELSVQFSRTVAPETSKGPVLIGLMKKYKSAPFVSKVEKNFANIKYYNCSDIYPLMDRLTHDV